jgi:hypothetical protein
MWIKALGEVLAMLILNRREVAAAKIGINSAVVYKPRVY